MRVTKINNSLKITLICRATQEIACFKMLDKGRDKHKEVLIAY